MAEFHRLPFLNIGSFKNNPTRVLTGALKMLKYAKLLANHTSGLILPNLQSATPIQTVCFDEGGKVKTGQKIALQTSKSTPKGDILFNDPLFNNYNERLIWTTT